eukprot:NODE_84_length_22349_cov_0.357888.p3 type:complete len:504 gc:universal NODE_84_length_22349_cov_0.357888:4261-2750(-)
MIYLAFFIFALEWKLARCTGYGIIKPNPFNCLKYLVTHDISANKELQDNIRNILEIDPVKFEERLSRLGSLQDEPVFSSNMVNMFGESLDVYIFSRLALACLMQLTKNKLNSDINQKEITEITTHLRSGVKIALQNNHNLNAFGYNLNLKFPNWRNWCRINIDFSPTFHGEYPTIDVADPMSKKILLLANLGRMEFITAISAGEKRFEHIGYLAYLLFESLDSLLSHSDYYYPKDSDYYNINAMALLFKFHVPPMLSRTLARTSTGKSDLKQLNKLYKTVSIANYIQSNFGIPSKSNAKKVQNYYNQLMLQNLNVCSRHDNREISTLDLDEYHLNIAALWPYVKINKGLFAMDYGNYFSICSNFFDTKEKIESINLFKMQDFTVFINDVLNGVFNPVADSLELPDEIINDENKRFEYNTMLRDMDNVIAEIESRYQQHTWDDELLLDFNNIRAKSKYASSTKTYNQCLEQMKSYLPSLKEYLKAETASNFREFLSVRNQGLQN